MWKIKDITIDSEVVLAPMAGVSFLAYRDFMKPFGVGLSVSEMVSDCGLIYNNQTTLEYIKTSNIDHPVAIQLFGNDAETIIKAIDICFKNNKDIDIIDINLGCPVPKVTKAGSGSALLKDPKHLYEMMKLIVAHSPVPVTCKIRLGYYNDNLNFLENIKALEDAGVSAIALHTRSAKQLYSGVAHHELAKDLGLKMKVPLIISGDIFTLEDAINAKEITKASAVMVARGGVGNPYLVKQISHYFKTGEKLPKISLEENIKYMLQLVDMSIAQFGEIKAIMIMRGIVPKFFNGYPNTKQIKNEICQSITTKQSLIGILKKYNLIEDNNK